MMPDDNEMIEAGKQQIPPSMQPTPDQTLVALDDKQLKGMLLGLIPETEPKGNVTLMNEWKKAIKDKGNCEPQNEQYWKLRDELIDEGKIDRGRGRGGSVFRVQPTTKGITDVKGKKKAQAEDDFYEPFRKYLNETWLRDRRFEPKDYVLKITAKQGRRKTGGKWTRPDLVAVTVKRYPYVPERILDVFSFEIKTYQGMQIEAVYETASHSAYAHRSYLAVHIPKGEPEPEAERELFERVKSECARFRVGFIVFEDPEDASTYETLVDPDRGNPDPEDVNDFIHKQIPESERQKIADLCR